MEDTHFNHQGRSIMGNLKIICFMEKVQLLILMEIPILGLLKTIIKMDLEFINMLMADNIVVNGKMESRMEKVFSLIKKESKEKEYGKMAKELNGSNLNQYLSKNLNIYPDLLLISYI